MWGRLRPHDAQVPDRQRLSGSESRHPVRDLAQWAYKRASGWKVMRSPVARVLLLSMATFGVLALSGCMGNAVTVSGQGYTSGSKSQHLECGGTGQLAYGKQGTGKMTITVLDGDGNQAYYDGDVGAGQKGASHTVNGVPGEWTLKVTTGFGYVGQWAITLSC